MVTVSTHLYQAGQLNGSSGSSGPFQPWMILPSSVIFSIPLLFREPSAAAAAAGKCACAWAWAWAWAVSSCSSPSAMLPRWVVVPSDHENGEFSPPIQETLMT